MRRCDTRARQLAACAVWCFASCGARAQAHDSALAQPLPSLPEYVQLGVFHVLIGYDHLAFVLGLMLLTRSRASLLWSVSAFSLAHSLSLSACVLGFLTPAAAWVELTIAASIAYVALAARRDALPAYPGLVSLACGFIHGFGFAGALEEIGVPPSDAPWALALFNGGVELGQLLALAIAAPLVARLRVRAHGLVAVRLTLLVLGLTLTVSRAWQLVA